MYKQINFQTIFPSLLKISTKKTKQKLTSKFFSSPLKARTIVMQNSLQTIKYFPTLRKMSKRKIQQYIESLSYRVIKPEKKCFKQLILPQQIPNEAVVTEAESFVKFQLRRRKKMKKRQFNQEKKTRSKTQPIDYIELPININKLKIKSNKMQPEPVLSIKAKKQKMKQMIRDERNIFLFKQSVVMQRIQGWHQEEQYDLQPYFLS